MVGAAKVESGPSASRKQTDPHAVRADPDALGGVADCGAWGAVVLGETAAGERLRLPADRVLFAGFLPPKTAGRTAALEALKSQRQTLVFFESGPRLKDSLTDMAAVLGPRPAAVARELTKLYEECVRGPLDVLAADPRLQSPKGEIVVVVAPGTGLPCGSWPAIPSMVRMDLPLA